jgi:large subunit ribosomal protein L15
MQLHNLKRENPNKKARQVGRGGTRGKTSGRGGKGQTARAGNKRRPELRDIIKKLPKMRGYRTRSFEKKNVPVNLQSLEIYNNGDIVTKESLFEKKLIRKVGGILPPVKILAKGELTKKIIIVGCLVSEKAKEQIEKIGGEIK